ncbi:MAG: hypothetical protein V2A76_16105 [Planctomycetota bacterium]
MSHPAKNVLIIAFHFPPIAAAGTHRTLNFVRQLSRRGYGLGVLTTSSFGGLGLDWSLAGRVPAGVLVARAPHVDPFRVLARLHKARSGRPEAAVMPTGEGGGPPDRPRLFFPRALDYASRLANLPDRYTSWIPLAVARGILLGRRIGAEVIYSTAPPYSAHLVGLFLSKVLGLPWVADLRDPWTLNPFHANPYPSLCALDRTMERWVMFGAQRVILNTRQAEAGYRERYPDLDQFCTINNGIDPDLLSIPPEPPARSGRLTLLHIGSIYGRRFPRGLIEALARLRDSDPDLYRRIVVEQIGPEDHGERLLAEAKELGVADQLRLRGPVSHAEALRRCRQADGLLLLGPRGAEPEVQVPSKLFEYLAAGRPVFALAQLDGAIASLLADVDRPHVIADPNDPAGIHDGLRRFAALSEHASARVAETGAGLERLNYETLTTLLEDELEQAVRPGTASRDAEYSSTGD